MEIDFLCAVAFKPMNIGPPLLAFFENLLYIKGNIFLLKKKKR